MIEVGNIVKGIKNEDGLFEYIKINKAEVKEIRFHMMNILILECEDETRNNTEIRVFVDCFDLV